jgi:hypothetical protein
MASTMLIVTFYASGMPFLYVFGFVFFFFNFVAYKVLFFHYYKKNPKQFSHEIL